MSDAQPNLQRLEELYSKRDAISLRKQDSIAQAIPQEVKEQLEVIEAEYFPVENAISEEIERIEAVLKEAAINGQGTIQGQYYQVVYTRGGYSASAKDVQNVANRWEKTNPEVAADIRSILTVKKSSASIKPRGGA